MTGAPVPAGVDAVVMVEQTDMQGQQVAINANVSARAEYFASSRRHASGTGGDEWG